MKVYFAGSIRGGRVDANLYARLIKYIQKTDVVRLNMSATSICLKRGKL